LPAIEPSPKNNGGRDDPLHQGKDNVILFPSEDDEADEGTIVCRERLGGMLKFYHRETG
jgi:hypothetical protein